MNMAQGRSRPAAVGALLVAAVAAAGLGLGLVSPAAAAVPATAPAAQPAVTGSAMLVPFAKKNTDKKMSSRVCAAWLRVIQQAMGDAYNAGDSPQSILDYYVAIDAAYAAGFGSCA
jgi:NAD(P)H-hydrate repair Nnr-like enzyme with NAD(P)H-hydrate dehydratase domain